MVACFSRARLVRLQCRRHARAAHCRALRVGAASSAQCVEAGSHLDAAVPGPELRRRVGADNAACAGPFSRWPAAGWASMGRHGPGGIERNLWRLPAEEGLEGVPGTQSESAARLNVYAARRRRPEAE